MGVTLRPNDLRQLCGGLPQNPVLVLRRIPTYEKGIGATYGNKRVGYSELELGLECTTYTGKLLANPDMPQIMPAKYGRPSTKSLTFSLSFPSIGQLSSNYQGTHVLPGSV